MCNIQKFQFLDELITLSRVFCYSLSQNKTEACINNCFFLASSSYFKMMSFSDWYLQLGSMLHPKIAFRGLPSYLYGYCKCRTVIPLEWRQSIRLSSLRAWVRFSSWSWRWIFSSIRAWIVSCSSKLILCRTSRARGTNKSDGLLMSTSAQGLCHIFRRQIPLKAASESQEMRFAAETVAAVYFICLNTRGGDNCLFLSKAMGGKLPVGCFKIHPMLPHQWSQRLNKPRQL